MNNNAQGSGQQDYLDKAFNAGAKKFGGAQGQKVAKNGRMSEKIVRRSLCHIPTVPLTNTIDDRLMECVQLTRSLPERKSTQSTPTRVPAPLVDSIPNTVFSKGERIRYKQVFFIDRVFVVSDNTYVMLER